MKPARTQARVFYRRRCPMARCSRKAGIIAAAMMSIFISTAVAMAWLQPVADDEEWPTVRY